MFILAKAAFAFASNLGTLHGVQNSQGTFWKKYVCSEYDLDMIIITKEIFKSINTGISKELFLVKAGFVKILENNVSDTPRDPL